MTLLKADFDKMIDAKKVVSELKNLGYKAHIDMADTFGTEFSMQAGIPGRTALSLSAVVLKPHTSLYAVGKTPLLASNPMVSGSSITEESRGINVKLLVNIPEDRMDEIKNLISGMGGNIR